MGTSAAAETLIYLGLDGHPISDAPNYVSHVTYFAPVAEPATMLLLGTGLVLSLIHISEPTRPILVSRMPSSA